MDPFLPADYFIPAIPHDFTTHHNYVDCLSKLSTGLEIEYRSRVSPKPISLDGVHKKITLIKFTKQSIDAEKAIILTNPDYAQVCVSWVSVKSYYLLFNLMLILKYLMSCQASSLNATHSQLLKEYTTYLKNGDLIFSEPRLNEVRSAEVINSTKVVSGANISVLSYDLDTRMTQIFKKLCAYDLEEFKRREKIETLHKKVDRLKCAQYVSGLELSPISFFYWYRIKANYRDLDFIDGGPGSIQLANYYLSYHKLTSDFYDAFKNLINSVASDRLGNTNLLIP